jgi:phosphomannomutase
MGGTPIQSKSGHAFIKETMRASNAVYGGEMSAHHYFRDFSYADSGMIPWLLVAQIMSQRACPLSQLVDERMANFPASGEINRKVEDADVALSTLESRYRDSAISVEHVDGLSMEFEDWRFNLRASNTEPLVRLNVESRNNPALMEAKTEELLTLIGGDPG